MIQQFLPEQLVHALGWTLVHALWQAALFAIALGLLLLALRKFSARARYTLAIGMLAAFFVTAGLTFAQLYLSGAAEVVPEVATTEVKSTATAPTPQTADLPAFHEVIPDGPLANQKVIAPAAPTLMERISDYYGQHLPLIVTLWFMGVLILQLRFLGQLVYIQRLKNYGIERFPSRFAPMLQELEAKMKLTKPVRYLSSFRIASPFTAGWLRPVVLFPATLLEQLKEPELQTIMAHELAHIRRHDFLVNLIQTLLCILFFYHPAVWWMSARIEEEREHCCDDLAIAVTGERVGYAKTLLQLKESELNPALAMNLLGKQGFKQRINRLLSGYLGTGTYREGFVSALILTTILVTAVGLSGQTTNSPATAETFIQQPQTEAETPTDNFIDELVDDVVDNLLDSPEETPESDNFQSAFKGDTQDLKALISPTTLPGEIAGFTNDSTVFFFLLQAIDDGNIPLVKYFLDQDVNLDYEDENGWFPLAVAAGEDQPEVLKLLLDRGADVNYVNRRGWTALIEAADEGAYECAVILLARGADKELKGPNYRRTALDMAASEGHRDIMELLVEKGAQIESTEKSTTPLHEAAEEGNINVVNFMVQSGVKADVLDEYDRTPLSYAAEEGNTRIVEYLLQNGANPNSYDEELRTAMSYAAEEGHPEIIQLLFQYGATHHGKDASGRTPMDYAVDELADVGQESIGEVKIPQGHTSGQLTWTNDGHGLDEVVRQLSARGALADGVTVDREGRVIIKLEDLQRDFSRSPGEIMPGGSPGGRFDVDVDHEPAVANGGNLVYLVAQGDLLAIKDQLRRGADPDQHGTDNHTPLTMAARENDLEAARILLESGADPDHPDYNGMRAKDIALRDNLVDFLRLLNENGASVTALLEDGSSPLDGAARDGHVEVLRYLLEQGAQPDGGLGPSPLFYAAREDAYSAARLLLQKGANTESRCNARDSDYFGRKHPDAATTIALYRNLTPLLAAITDKSLETAKLLVRSGANVNAKCYKVRYLSGKKLDWRTIDNLTPAQMEAQYKKAYEVSDWTPLLEAVEANDVPLVRLLLRSGADKEYTSENGMTALSLARKIGNQEVIDLLD